MRNKSVFSPLSLTVALLTDSVSRSTYNRCIRGRVLDESSISAIITMLTAYTLYVEGAGRAPLCVSACVNWHVIDITRKLRFAQPRIGIISDHVIAASAGQRERSRSGSATGYFLHFFVLFLFFASSSYY